ncbi:DNA cytosine methyltransferase [Tomitella gaofuii]|uniref:DNA cytosine methyltransferase n=1 Tax=Tomitella gaofuii TaxID=2760083 RepID=UPI0015FC511E|nr:DNA cytosine methyltransferase [Tomitella gaofuii]
MTLTLTDLFCGAGGSSTGAVQVPGVQVRVASNHWQLAVDTHNKNHPGADHICADLSQISPEYFPPSELLWASPECTNHSIARGRKYETAAPDLFGETLPDDAAERSRATMWDVVRFTERHRYQAVMVENVVDAVRWQPWRAWLMAMDSLGYHHQTVMLNSAHAQLAGEGAPQSRDRMYVVFWRKGNRKPDLHRVTRPRAVCAECGPVRAMQSWKRDDRPEHGRYRAQYVYRCPNMACRNAVVEPLVRTAADVIDWTHQGTRIGDRTRPLADKTMNRIRSGIEEYWAPLAVPVEGREGKRAAPVDRPFRTMTTRNETGLAFIAELRGGGSKHRPVTHPLSTVTASGNHHGLVRGEKPSVDIDDVRFRMLEPEEVIRAMDFPSGYEVLGTRRERVRMAGNAVTPPAARDLVSVVSESLN